MDKPVSVRRIDKHRSALDNAQRLRRERIRAQSRAVAEYLAVSPESRAFYEDWGTPDTQIRDDG